MASTFTTADILPQPGQQRDRGAAKERPGGKESTLHPVSTDASSQANSNSQLPSPQNVVLDAASLKTGRGGGGSLRSINQEFNVNPSSGSLSLDIPLPITKGRRDFHPSLSLSYDSGNGNGPFGFGWHIAAPSITRKTSHRIPEYRPGDTFVLSGAQDLVPIKDNVQQTFGDYLISRYRLRIEHGNVLRVEQWASTKNPDDVYWKTTSSENVTSIYGRDDSSRIFETSASQKRIFSWLLCESYDPFGNAIRYTYKAENDDNIVDEDGNRPMFETRRDSAARSRNRYLKSIRYGNSTPCRHLETWAIDPSSLSTTVWHYEVLLDYGEHADADPETTEAQPWAVRKDPFTSCRSGFEIRTYRLCRRVLLFHHFPQELGKVDYLVESMSFSYEEVPTGSFLRSVVRNSHVFDKTTKTYLTESLPPLDLDYCKMPSLETLGIHSIKPASLQTLPVSSAATVTRWIDLDGDGTPGLLVQTRGAWYYQRNQKPLNSRDPDADSSSDSEPDIDLIDNFGPVRQLHEAPVIRDFREATFEDLDGSGCQHLVVIDENGDRQGFYERTNKVDEGDWAPMQYFKSTINTTGHDGYTRLIDLTGNGISDILTTDNYGKILWYESLGKEGWGSQHVCNTATRDECPVIHVTQERTATYLADMTGDGLDDIVQVSNGHISYWPNLGYGRFGGLVAMENSPIMDIDPLFTFERLHLLDIDGSGTKDIVYLPPQGGLMVYYNYCGNSWSDGIFVDQFPQIDRLSSVFTADVLGNGTTCLCWAGPENSAVGDLIIRYLDLAGGRKPYALSSFINGQGRATNISYRPSTKFSLKDELAGKPWKTKLPFPVHVVSRVTERDSFALAKRVTKYAYHEGVFNAQEQEFCGFGMVESWEREEVKVAISEAKPYQKPTTHTKMWFHTGSYDMPLAPERVFGEVSVQTVFPTGLDSFTRGQFCYALKGLEIRMEIYGLDGSESSCTPYSVRESTYDVQVLQEPKNLLAPGAFRVSERESVSVWYERDVHSAPRIEHEMALARNLYGDIAKSVTIFYGHPKSSLEDQRCKVLQSRHEVAVTETCYTNAIDIDVVADFYKPLVASKKTVHVQGLQIEGLLDINATRDDPEGVLGLRPAQEPSKPATPSLEVIQGKESRIFYRSRDLKRRLELGRIESGPVVIVDQEYTLAMTQPECHAAYGTRGERLFGYSLATLMTEGGHCELEGDGNWWVPSSRNVFSRPDIVASELTHARQSFFTPTCIIDAFGSVSTIDMDQHFLLPELLTDAVGNRTKAKNDYRTLRPVLVTDSNENRTSLVYNSFGDVTAVAKLGKIDEECGDYEDPDVDMSNSKTLLAEFMKQPSKHAATELLGGWGNRWIYSHGLLQVDGCQLPPFVIDIARTDYAHDEKPDDALPGDILLTISYFNSGGQVVQRASVDSWQQNPLQWRISDWCIKDMDNRTVKAFQPIMFSDHRYKSHLGIDIPSIHEFTDSLGRQVGTLFSDHTWVKTSFGPWSQMDYRVVDTIMITDPRNDDDVGYYFRSLPLSTFLPSWMEMNRLGDSKAQLAADRSAGIFMNGSVVSHWDSNGREVLHVTKAGDSSQMLRFEFDCNGETVREFDAVGRLVQQSQYDQQGNCIAASNMDSGCQTTIYDISGHPLLHCDERGIRRNVFDQLRRPLETWFKETPGTEEYLLSKIAYGDENTGGEGKNLREKIVTQYDQSGVRDFLSYNLNGEAISKTVQLVADYKGTIDWSKEVQLDPTIYKTRESYDAIGRLQLSTDADRRQTRRTFDTQGRISRLETKGPEDPDWTILIERVIHEPDGLPGTIKYGNGSTTRYTYDGHTRHILTKKTRRSDGSMLEDLSYTYDCLNRLIQTSDVAQQDVYYRNKLVKPIKEYWYDRWGRLAKATGRELVSGDGAGSLSARSTQDNPLIKMGLPIMNGQQMAAYTETFTYDDADNILVLRHDIADTVTASWTRTCVYEEPSLLEPQNFGNRLSCTQASARETFSYETCKAGGQTSGCLASMPGFSHLQWDSSGMLKASSRQVVSSQSGQVPEITWYVYDGQGTRIRKVTERASTLAGQHRAKLKETIYLEGVEIFIRYKGDGSIASQVTTSHVGSNTQGNGPLVMAERKDSFSTLLRYNLSPSLEVDEQARIISYEEYSAFGTSTLVACRATIEAPSNYRFASYRRDKETGFYHCGARYYLPHLGRWLSPDPLGVIDGPNTYAYCSNDPINWVDPTGTVRRPPRRTCWGDVKHYMNPMKPSVRRRAFQGLLTIGSTIVTGSLTTAYAGVGPGIGVAAAGLMFTFVINKFFIPRVNCFWPKERTEAPEITLNDRLDASVVNSIGHNNESLVVTALDERNDTTRDRNGMIDNPIRLPVPPPRGRTRRINPNPPHVQGQVDGSGSEHQGNVNRSTTAPRGNHQINNMNSAGGNGASPQNLNVGRRRGGILIPNNISNSASPQNLNVGRRRGGILIPNS